MESGGGLGSSTPQRTAHHCALSHIAPKTHMTVNRDSISKCAVMRCALWSVIVFACKLPQRTTSRSRWVGNMVTLPDHDHLEGALSRSMSVPNLPNCRAKRVLTGGANKKRRPQVPRSRRPAFFA